VVESYLGGRIVVNRIVDVLNVELHLKSGMFANQHFLKMLTALAQNMVIYGASATQDEISR
jgi:hypothetical protein